MKKLWAVTVLFAMACGSAYADRVGVRGAMGDVRGADENFDAYEVFAVFDLPWAWEREASRVQTQLELRAGALDAAGQSGFIGALVPGVAIHMGEVLFDIGGGVAVLGEDRFGDQDFGGSSQFIAQGGVAFWLTGRVSTGVRFRHISDGGMHNGEDLNLVLIEVSYAFN